VTDAAERAAACQEPAVIEGDYNLKLLRQRYVAEKQELLVKHLVGQKARREFLSAVYS